MKFVAATLAWFLLAAAGASASAGWQLDERHSGGLADPALTADLDERWSRTLPRQASHPLVAGGRVFVVAGGRTHAFDAATGEALWTGPWRATS